MDDDYSLKTCFVVTPVGGDSTDIRRAVDGVIDSVITPALLGFGFQPDNIFVPHKMPQPGSITGQVIDKLLYVDLVVANLTNLNPNVMYELAIRHAIRKPVIQICEKVGPSLPFDIIDQRTIFYKNDMKGVLELKEEFSRMLPIAIQDQNPDNPIYRVVTENIIKQNPGAMMPAELVMERLSAMEKSLNIIVKQYMNRTMWELASSQMKDMFDKTIFDKHILYSGEVYKKPVINTECVFRQHPDTDSGNIRTL